MSIAESSSSTAECDLAMTVESHDPTGETAQIDYPEETQPVIIAWGHTLGISAIHLLALLACLPWMFSWSGIVLAVVGFFVYGLLGINLCFHRILTHNGAKLPKWLEHCFATLGVCCLQESPARWVAIHRLHHKHSDRRPDPHSPLVNFLWSHVGWLCVENREHSRYRFFEHYARDVLRDPFYLRFERKYFWLWTYLIHAALYFLVGLAIGWATTGQVLSGVQFGASCLVWGVFVRTVFEWHNTWAVNSITHLWGYRNYETKDDSRNHWLVALTAHGEGWHNNHHADQRSAQHGHRWWEYDLTWTVIRFLESLGIAKDVVRPIRRRPFAAWPRPHHRDCRHLHRHAEDPSTDTINVEQTVDA